MKTSMLPQDDFTAGLAASLIMISTVPCSADIKPDNFLFIKGKLLLTDFGLVTQMGHTLRRQGTPGYWAPEVEKEHQIPWSAAQDYWSLGKCL